MQRRSFLRAGLATIAGLFGLSTASESKLRTVQRFNLVFDLREDRIKPVWITCRMADLKTGDYFRIYELDGESLGYFRAQSDGFPCNGDGAVEAVQVQWIELPQSRIVSAFSVDFSGQKI